MLPPIESLKQPKGAVRTDFFFRVRRHVSALLLHISSFNSSIRPRSCHDSSERIYPLSQKPLTHARSFMWSEAHHIVSIQQHFAFPRIASVAEDMSDPLPKWRTCLSHKLPKLKWQQLLRIHLLSFPNRRLYLARRQCPPISVVIHIYQQLLVLRRVFFVVEIPDPVEQLLSRLQNPLLARDGIGEHLFCVCMVEGDHLHQSRPCCFS